MPYWFTTDYAAAAKAERQRRGLEALAGGLGKVGPAVGRFADAGVRGVIDPQYAEQVRAARSDVQQLGERVGAQTEQAKGETTPASELLGQEGSEGSALHRLGSMASQLWSGRGEETLSQAARLRSKLRRMQDEYARVKALGGTLKSAKNPGALLKRVAPDLGVGPEDYAPGGGEVKGSGPWAEARRAAVEKYGPGATEAQVEREHARMVGEEADIRGQARRRYDKPDKPNAYESAKRDLENAFQAKYHRKPNAYELKKFGMRFKGSLFGSLPESAMGEDEFRAPPSVDDVPVE